MGRETDALEAIYVLRSGNGIRVISGTYTQARQAACEWQSEIKAAHGVTVELKDGDGTVFYTAK